MVAAHTTQKRGISLSLWPMNKTQLKNWIIQIRLLELLTYFTIHSYANISSAFPFKWNLSPRTTCFQLFTFFSTSIKSCHVMPNLDSRLLNLTLCSMPVLSIPDYYLHTYFPWISLSAPKPHYFYFHSTNSHITIVLLFQTVILLANDDDIHFMTLLYRIITGVVDSHGCNHSPSTALRLHLSLMWYISKQTFSFTYQSAY